MELRGEVNIVGDVKAPESEEFSLECSTLLEPVVGGLKNESGSFLLLHGTC